MLLVFHTLIAAHIATGATGALAFWIPVLGRKGGRDHRRWGRVFAYALLATGGIAIAMSLFTIADPLGMHPHLAGQFDAPFLRGMFGWMMLHNAILTINLAWYGYLCIVNRQNHARNRGWLNVTLQYVVMAAAVNCAVQGYLIWQPLMMGIAVVGIATGLTNLYFIYKRRIERADWLKEHIKALVGAGISVYTAFLAFGSVRIFPSLALNPVMWAVPLSVGLAIIIYPRGVIDLQTRRQRAARGALAASGD